MKKKIEADLAEIAEKILQNKGNFNTMELKNGCTAFMGKRRRSKSPM